MLTSHKPKSADFDGDPQIFRRSADQVSSSLHAQAQKCGMQDYVQPVFARLKLRGMKGRRGRCSRNELSDFESDEIFQKRRVPVSFSETWIPTYMAARERNKRGEKTQQR